MMNVIIPLAVLLVVLIAVLLFRVQSLLSIAKGDDDKPGFGFNKFNGAMFIVFMVTMFTLFIWYTFAKMDAWMLPEASTPHGRDTDSMLWSSLLICSVAFLITNALLFIFSYKYQYKKDKKATFYPENSILEIVWTVIPALVLTFLIFNGWKSWSSITERMTKEQITAENVVELELVGQQFKWSCRYPGADKKLGTHYFRRIDGTNEMGLKVEDKNGLDDFMPREIHLPVGRKVIVYLRAKDVLHSMFIPHFRAKMDCVPGEPTQFAFVADKTTMQMRSELEDLEFNYEIVCTEICGGGHFNMRYKIVVETEDEYKEWYESQEAWSKENKGYIIDKLKEIDPTKVNEFSSYIVVSIIGLTVNNVSVSGTITGEDGIGIVADVEVVDYTKDEVVATIKTDSNGVYTFDVAKGSNYGVTYISEGYLFSSKNFTFIESFGDTYESNVRLNKVKAGASVALRNVFFDTGNSHLKPSSKKELKKLISLLEANPTMKIAVIGHTDNVGEPESNHTLSEERAHSVVNYVVDSGIDASRLKFEGKGETSPVADNETEEGRKLNRRTELSIIEL